MKTKLSLLPLLVLGMTSLQTSFAQKITRDAGRKKVTISNEKISAVLDYSRCVNISFLGINGQPVINGTAGIYSAIKTKSASYSTLNLKDDPRINISSNVIKISEIIYGDKSLTISENWTVTVGTDSLKFDIDRTLSKSILAEKAAFPVFNFDNINTWDGAYQDYGGFAWFYLFNKRLDTYGVHSNSSLFWNSKTGNGLAISISAYEKKIVMDYSRTQDDKLAFTIGLSDREILPRFDSLTHRRRFVRNRSDVWEPIKLEAGLSRQSVSFSYFNFNKKYGRGNLVGVNGDQVSAVLNTIARIGIIDKYHFGGNSWHTPYGPVCLHEQYIAQLGLAINDVSYLNGYQECLDFYRDNAIRSGGRVWPRWAYSNEDAMPERFNEKGFYEAQWGYLLDSNPDYVTNVVELYQQTGNLTWIKSHQTSCERALDWILKRDGNNNSLVEMKTDSLQQKQGSDWIDIIWASYENAFINAKLYHALELWSSVERQLGNPEKEKYYYNFSQALKNSFNKSTGDGGFWDDEKKCYVHWRDKNGSIHGRNMVTPVNFMAIGYGICDNESRAKQILDDIEEQMQKEQLFFWPLCMYTYAPGEGNDWQFPFPSYENGDLFLSWGALGVKAYAEYKPELALKYVKNVLAQYAKDGLAFQRYGRTTQDGLGDDILSGNCLSVVGLYQAIYGINPLHNRFYLDPHITESLAGTQVQYNYRGQHLAIDLAMNDFSVSNGQFKISAKHNFGFFSLKNEVSYFDRNGETRALRILTSGNLAIDVKIWSPERKTWRQSSESVTFLKLTYEVDGLQQNTYYTITIDGKMVDRIKSGITGSLIFNCEAKNGLSEISVINK